MINPQISNRRLLPRLIASPPELSISDLIKYLIEGLQKSGWSDTPEIREKTTISIKAAAYLMGLLLLGLLSASACTTLPGSLINKPSGLTHKSQNPSPDLPPGSPQVTPPRGSQSIDVNSADPNRRQDLQVYGPYAPENTVRCFVSTLDPTVWQGAPGGAHSTDIAGVFPLRGCGLQRPYMLSIDRSSYVYLWDLTTAQGRQIANLLEPIELVTFSENSNIVALSHGSAVKLFSAGRWEKIGSLLRLKSRITAMDFHPDGRSLLLGAGDGQIYRWHFEKEAAASTLDEQERSLERYSGHAEAINTLIYHPFGRVFFSADWSGVLSAWFGYDSAPHAGMYDKNALGPLFFSRKPLRQKENRRGLSPIERLNISADGRTLLAGLGDGGLEAWKVRGFVRAGEIAAHQGLIYAVALSADGTQAASSGRDGKLKIWRIEETEDKRLPLKFSLQKQFEISGVHHLAFLGSHGVIAARSDGKIWTVRLD
ncbi:MAG: WD40 repeat domain-containing protein [Deltaproteobacteria bacterium]|nr:WD40 repeat domain-containing protein [Deltaproteobacteria bacterium]